MVSDQASSVVIESSIMSQKEFNEEDSIYGDNYKHISDGTGGSIRQDEDEASDEENKNKN